MYRQKFKNNVKNKFIRYDDNIENMKNLIKIFDRIRRQMLRFDRT